MRGWRSIGGLMAWLALSGVAPALADPCAFARLAVLPLDLSRGVPVVEAGFNGQTARLVLDTGSTQTVLTQAAVARMGLPRDPTSLYAQQAVGGGQTVEGALVHTLQLGGVTLADQRIAVLPFPLRGWGDAPPEGLLGLEALAHFELDLDLPHGRLTLYRDRDCPSGGPNWPPGYVTLPRPPGRLAEALILVPVLLDGRLVAGTLDSGASTFLLDTATAVTLGVTPAMLARDPGVTGRGVTSTNMAVRLHRFAALRIGNDIMANPVLAVGDTGGASHLLVGADWLRRNRVWISVPLRRVFVAPKGLPP